MLREAQVTGKVKTIGRADYYLTLHVAGGHINNDMHVLCTLPNTIGKKAVQDLSIDDTITVVGSLQAPREIEMVRGTTRLMNVIIAKAVHYNITKKKPYKQKRIP